jgi:endoglucanase
MIRNVSIKLGFLLSFVVAACDPGTTAVAPKGTVLPSTTACSADEVGIGNDCFAVPKIKVDTIGYLPSRAKFATVPASDAGGFEIVDAETDEVVYEGDLADETENADTGDTTQLADFSELTTAGTYVLRVEGFDDSPPFIINANAWDEALQVTMLGLYGLRCGVDVEFEFKGVTFKHEACHLEDGIIGAELDGSGRWSGGETKDGTGGWHDAGDYGKYTVNGSFALAFILKAWEDFGDRLSQVKHIPDYEGAMPQWLAEAKFQMDQLLKMQLEDGSAAHMLGPSSFPGSIMPEKDLADRHFTGPGSAATADLVAVAAMAARVFRPYDEDYADRCLDAAELGQAFLDANTTAFEPSYAGFTHAAYGHPNEAGARLWALAELWRTTADAGLLTRVEELLPSKASVNFDWADASNLGLFSYVQATSDARNADKLKAAQDAVIVSAETLVTNTASHAYGRGLGTSYWWGVNGVLARSTINLFVANSLSPDPRYLDAAAQQVDHLFGRNPFGRTMVTGIGYLPVQSPHHRPSDGDRLGPPWPGLVVGGPNPGDKLATASAPGLFWFDSSEDYYVNEVAINWSTALAYALAGFRE